MALPPLNYKKILIIVGFTLVSLGLAYAVVRIFFIGPAEPEAVPLAGLQPGGNLPDVGFGGLRPLGTIPGSEGLPTNAERAANASEVARGGDTKAVALNPDPVLEPQFASGGSLAYYSPADGYFYRQSSDSQIKTLLTDEQFFNVSSVAWAPRQERAVLEFPDGANILYDFTKRQSLTLPKEVTSPSFSDNGQQLVYKLDSAKPGNNFLVTSDASGANVRFIEPLGERVDQVQVVTSPNMEVIALYGKATSIGSSEVFPLGQQGENYRSVEVSGLDFQGKYAPDGRRLLYHVISPAAGYKPVLWVTDGRPQTLGLNNLSLGLQTWIDKCAFAGDSRIVYCAVPVGLPEGAGLSEDIARGVPDEFFRLDLDTGLKTRLAVPVSAAGESNFSAIEVWLSPDESELHFWDWQTGGVYKIRLK